MNICRCMYAYIFARITEKMLHYYCLSNQLYMRVSQWLLSCGDAIFTKKECVLRLRRKASFVRAVCA